MYCCLLPVMLATAGLHAQTSVPSGVQTAGFTFSADAAAVEPVIHYQQNISMLAGIDDRLSMRIFGDGRVQVHYPVYMKKAGDYEMQLDETELVDLIASLSSDGIMAFDEAKAIEKVRDHKKALREKNRFYEISDAVETVVEIKLDEYQKDQASKKVKNFHKAFRWKNIEHDAARYRHDELTRANNSVTRLKGLMKDVRLVNKVQR